MYPPRFHYEAPATLEEALQLLRVYRGDHAKVLTGGMSLIPLMKLRFASPSAIIDLNNIPGLDYIVEEGGWLRVGALVRNRALVRSDLLRSRYPLWASAAPQISDPLVRNRGTLVGSLCHADPQGDWGSVMLAMDGEVVARSIGGERRIPVSQFFAGPFQTTLAPEEIAVEARVRAPEGRPFGLYQKLERRIGDFATVAVGVHLEFGAGGLSRAGIGLTGVGPTNIKAVAAEQALLRGGVDDRTIGEVAELAAQAAQPRSDHRGSEEYKRDMVRVFVARALERASGREPFDVRRRRFENARVPV